MSFGAERIGGQRAREYYRKLQSRGGGDQRGEGEREQNSPGLSTIIVGRVAPTESGSSTAALFGFRFRGDRDK